MYSKAGTLATSGFTFSPGAHLSHVCVPASSTPWVEAASYRQRSPAISQIALRELGGPSKAIIFKLGNTLI